MEYKPFHIESNKNQHAREREGSPGASYERTTRKQESQEDREARLDRQRLRTNHSTPRQRWVPQLVLDKIRTGVPKGSVLEPILFILKFNYDR